jgi:EAL domain-containing protein (putative c-di-GMP-specific phosphodiesterase class I)
MDLHVIAEGVETAEELKFLDEKGCQTYQGFYFSRPLEWSAYQSYLATHPSSE